MIQNGEIFQAREESAMAGWPLSADDKVVEIMLDKTAVYVHKKLLLPNICNYFAVY